jgi:hypothetical protein
MKIVKSSIIIAASSILLACSAEKSESNNSTESITESNTEETVDYQKAWDEFVQVVLNGTKSEVVAYLDPENEAIQNEVDLSFDYYFDEDLRDELIGLSYADLINGEYGGKPAKILAIHHSYVIDGTTLDSSYIYYFGETSKGLIIYDILIAG